MTRRKAVVARPRPGRYQHVGCLLFLLVIATACDERFNGATGPSPFGTTSGNEPVVREILAQMDSPPGAPGRRLTLVRYTIAPAAQLVPHIHPGIQMASIASGVLTYEVISGTVTIQRKVGPNGVPASTEQLTGPARTTLSRNDVVFEEGQMVHFGANMTSEPVVIDATLITEGSDLAVAVPATAQ